MNVDPLASMRCWAITVELGGREFEIPALPAVDWWPVIASMQPANILDMLKSNSETDEFELDGMLLDGRVTGEELSGVLRDVIEEVTGRTIQAAYVLALTATDRWDVVGPAVAQAGFRWDVQPIGAALDLVYSIIMSALKEENQKKFETLLEKDFSTPGRERVPDQRVISEFETMAGPRPSPAPLPEKAIAALSGGQRPRTRIRPRQPLQDDRSAGPRRQPGSRAGSGPPASSSAP